MAYTVPRVLIEQAFTAAPIFANNPLAAFIFGPNYRPLRYTEASEKSWTFLGNYDASAGIALTGYPWIASHAGSVVDNSKNTDGTWAHLTAYVEDAFALYFSPTFLVKGTLTPVAGASTITVATNSPNVTGVGTNFQTVLSIGSSVYDNSGTFVGTVATVTSDTAATLTANAAVAISGAAWKYATPHSATAIQSSVAGRYYANQVKATSLNFAPGVNPVTGAVYTRSTYFSARDVQVGDWVAVTGRSNGGGSDSAAPIVTVFAQITAVQADANGQYNILQTAQRIFDVSRTNGGTSTTLLNPGSTLAPAINLYLRKSTVMPSGFILSGTTTTTVGVNAAAAANNVSKLYDSALVDAGNTPVALTIGLPASGAASYVPARVYVSYRVLRTDNASSIQSLNDPSLVEATLGVVSPENPLAEGVYDALLNASGTNVYYMAVPTDDLAGYNAVLEQAKRLDTIYGLVPLTFDTTVITAVKSHVETMSTAAEAKWRKAWICLQPVTFGVLAGYDRAASGINWTTGTSTADPETNTAGVFVTIAPASGSNDPSLISNAVRAGDTLRVFADGTTTSAYADYTISAVRSQNELVTSTAVTGSGTRAIQILRSYTNDEQVAALGAATGNSRRVNAVFPHIAKTAGVDKAGYFVAAALAGLRAGSLPHAPLTNSEILGFDDFTTTLVTFTPTQLNNLAAYGYWIVTQDVAGGVPYVRHQLTTLGYNDVGDDPKYSEDSITTNLDSISYALQRALSPYIGRYNLNNGTLLLVETAIRRQLSLQMSESSNSAAGAQLLGFSIVSIGKSPVFKDKMVAVVTVDLPFPLNGVTLTLVVP